LFLWPLFLWSFSLRWSADPASGRPVTYAALTVLGAALDGEPAA